MTDKLNKKALLSSSKIRKHKEFWEKKLSGKINRVYFPFDNRKTRNISGYRDVVKFMVEEKNFTKLCKISSNSDKNLFVILIATLNTLLYKYTNNENIIIGSPIDKQENCGEFLNTFLVLKNTISDDITFKELLLQVKKTLKEADNNQNYPIDMILEELGFSMDNENTSLIQSMIVLENIHDKEYINKFKINMLFSFSKTDKYIEGIIEYNSELYEKSTINRIIIHFNRVLDIVLNNVNINLGDIDILSEVEKKQLIYDFNSTYAEYPSDKLIHELFEDQAERTPDNIAIVFEDKKLTYRELNEKSNGLARTLRERGIGHDNIVGIMVDRSIEMIVGIMGILKAGGGYLPIDPDSPKARIGYMLGDSRTNILLTQKHLIDKVDFKGEILNLEDENIYSENSNNLERVNNSKDLAYVIYTSGSTGNPKGVMIEHKSITTTLQWRKEEYGLSYSDNIILLFSYAFDGFVTSFFTPIISGAKIVILSNSELKDVISIKDKIQQYRITHFIATPSLCHLLMEQLTKEEASYLKIITLAGESLSEKVIEKIKELNRDIEIINEYGPTENSVVTTIARDVNTDKEISIGKPISNAKIYIVNTENMLQPIGTPGELCIGGDGLARGYLNNPQLTAEKFIENPFTPRERMYKTGDLARWLSDGNIEFLSRIDHQVKIRGFRIELGEIESKLLQHEDINEAVVLAKEDENNEKYLCAYLVCSREISNSEIRNHLKETLLEYMVPSYFISLDKMPLTPNGKINREILPEPNLSEGICKEYEAPRNEIEEKLVEIWRGVLGVEKIGINDSFFELGGHSLKATVLTSRIHKEFDIEVPLSETFNLPTIKRLSEYIQSTEKNIYSSIEKVEKKKHYEASSAEKRMYMLKMLEPQSTGYNMPTIMEVDGELHKEKLESAIKKLIQRHEALRTSFELIDGEIAQRVIENVDFKIEYIKEPEEEIELIIKNFVRAFDLSVAPLLRVGLIEINKKKHILMFDMHHIICDGVSIGILLNDFTKLYEGKELKTLRIQYKDYSAWQSKFLKSEKMKNQEEYWITKFSGEIPVLNMPYDYPRPAIQSLEGNKISFNLGQEITNKLKDMSKETESTMYMILLSVVNILLSKYSGQEDIIVGTPIAGRKHTELEGIIGMFVNTLALRNKPEGQKTYEEFLREVKENSLKAYENQDYQFEELVDKLNIPQNMSRNPLFDVMFVMQNMDIEEILLRDISFKQYKNKNITSKFDMTIMAIENNEELFLNIEYCTKLFKKETIERLYGHFINILNLITENRVIKLNEIEMLNDLEKHNLLYEFNDTFMNYQSDKTIHELFEEQVKKTPDNIAAVFEDKKLTYRELNQKANRLARTLRKKGIKSDCIVALMLERSIEMIVGIIGILKAGGAYLPIDPEYPDERINYMLEDSNVHMLLTEGQLLDKVKFKEEVINLMDDSGYAENGDNLDNVNSSKDLLYVIYTSGSTGKPKGVMIEHKNLNNLLNFEFNNTNIELKTKVLQFTTISFDVASQEIFSTLLCGGELYLVKDETRKNVNELINFIKNNEIDVVFLPTSYFMFIASEEKYLNELTNSIKHIVTAGEQLIVSETLRKCIVEKGVYIHNHYGPSETHVVTTYTIEQDGELIELPPIGKPIFNTQIYILDDNLKPVAVGVSGEIYISGDSLGRGYINREQLTSEKFIENPFVLGAKMYKTGDIGRWLSKGNIEFIGRIDHQVKIRGYRVEPGEIESQLMHNKFVKEAVVIDKQDKNGVKYLCAYLVCNKEIKTVELREYLLKNLADYMIPSHFVMLDKMPLNLNGKIDRKALPQPDESKEIGTEYEAPTNKIEEKVAELWSTVLDVGNVGINDNFFELGGHSLKVISLVSKIHKELNVEVPLKEIFKSPTIKGMSEYVQRTAENIYEEIHRIEERENYEVSSAQKRMYMLQQLDLQSTGYNIPGVMFVEGNLNVERVEEAFKKLIKRHETLRTSFEIIDEEIVQRVTENIDFRVEYIIAKEEEIEGIVKNFIRAFDLRIAPLLRAGIIEIHPQKYVLVFDMHHIIFDGASMGILINEFKKLYKGEELNKLRIQYKDFAVWQNNLLNSDTIKKQEEYWINRFSDEIPVLNMPTDYLRPLVQGIEGESINFEIDKALSNKLKEISKECDITLYMLLLATYNILLSKYSGQKDIIVGSPVTGRTHFDLHNVIGMFVNTLPMRNYPEGEKTFIAFLEEVKINALMAYENQDYQFEELVDRLNISRDASRNPIFDVMFAMQSIDESKLEIEGIKFTPCNFENKISKFDLTMTVLEIEDRISFNIEYSTRLFNKETIKRMFRHYENILVDISKDVKKSIRDINMISQDEREILIRRFNDTKVEYQKDKTIQEVFEIQAKKNPKETALIFDNRTMSYEELNRKSNQLAHKLREMGVQPDNIVGIMLDRSFEMVIGILGILKAGGAYFPIDPEYPEKRIEYMLEDSGTEILLTQSWHVGKVRFKENIIELDDIQIYQGDDSNLTKVNEPTDLAYIIYTSGSTGTPKGVMVEHKSLNNIIMVMQNEYPIEKNDAYLLKTNYTFDVSITELFGWIIGNGKLVILEKDYEKDVKSIIETVQNNKVTHINFVPSMLRVFVNYLDEKNQEAIKSLKYIMVAGEAFPIDLARELSKIIDIKIENIYGPTEATIYATGYSIKRTDGIDNVPIGKPLTNTKIYITSKNLSIQPIGVWGELCISGEGIARGYLNRADLTKEKFIANPFEEGEMIYRTGDLARWMPDGNVEVIGRIDEQVKVRGFRIELGEIESRLLQYDGIIEAVVLAKEDENNEKYLCAYLVCSREINNLEIRNYLKETLPDYMTPSYFVSLDKMPLTSNGKVDRKALPEPNLSEGIESEYEAPSNRIQEKLTELWREVLGVAKIGINDNFFDLGGHSLKATVLISKIHKELNLEVPLKAFFKKPTIKEISMYIENTKENPYKTIEKVEEKEYYETSSAQKRIYALQQFEKGSTAYNMPAIYELEGEIGTERIEKTFKKLVARHDALITYFQACEGEIIQKIDTEYEFKMVVKKDTEEEPENILKKFIRPFDLEEAPLFRAEVIESNEKSYLLIDMHHIISDGVSMNILINEFVNLYNGEKLEPLRIQYKDFAEWHNKFLKSGEMKKQEEYWIDRFNDEIPTLELSYDYERPIIQSFEGDNLNFTIDEETTNGLRKIAKESGSTMHMVLLSAFNILLSKYSKQEDIIVGTPIAGRPHADLQNIMGMFVNTLALRNNVSGEKPYIKFLSEVKENSLNAYEYQSYQFEELIEKVDIRRDTSRNPLFDVMFDMANITYGRELELDRLKLKQNINKSNVSKFDLTLTAVENDKTAAFSIEYCTKLFKEETIKRMSNHYIKILKSICENNEIRLSEIEIITKQEKNQILYDFNDTKTDYPKDKIIQELFEDQVEKSPDNIAVVFEDKKLTYRELNEKSNQLARVLRAKGVQVNSIVGIMVEQSLEMIIGIMGIIKAGGAYLPIDYKYPKDRIEYMIKDSKINLLLMQSILKNSVSTDTEIIFLDNEKLYSGETHNLKLINDKNDLAYVIYTSGSTGKPKGVLIKHISVTNLANWFGKRYDLDKNKNILQNTSISFDVSVEEILVSLLNGATIYSTKDYELIDRDKFRAFVEKNNISVVQLVPSTLQEFIIGSKKLESIEVLICGGESLPKSMKMEVIKLGYNLYNCYGPTETAVDAITTKCIEENPVVIGRPIDNTQVYITNNELQLQPIGVTGELCIAGDGLAKGYLNRPELTDEKFVRNRFESGKRMYKTGDLARWLPDGNIEFIGRIDNQVKIRGFRIELGEIENRLLSHKNIKEAAVLVRNNNNEKYLCAYVVCKEEIDSWKLREYLKESLPEYMVPSYFVYLEKMPVTTNGKIDRRALPEPNLDDILNEYEAPRNKVEETLVNIWSEVLGIKTMGINDNFFELGGHSLKAIGLVSKIHKELNKEIPLKELYKSPTIKDLSQFIEKSEENSYYQIDKVEEQSYYETSYGQKRLWILNQLNSDSTAYNLQGSLTIIDNSEMDITKKVLKEILKRHEAFRTRFKVIDENLVQIIDRDIKCEFDIVDISQYKEEEKEVKRYNIFTALAKKRFNLEISPLFEVRAIKISENEYELLFSMHHIISDGWSMDLLKKEFTLIHNSYKSGNECKIEPLKIQYKDFAAWQNNFIEDQNKSRKAKEYWHKQLNREFGILNLPRSYKNHSMNNKKSSGYRTFIPENHKDILKSLAKENNASLYSVLISIMNILISDITMQTDILIGTAVSGRDHNDLQNIIGYFVNTVLLINQINKDETFINLLERVNENTLNALEQQSYPIEKALDELKIEYPEISVFFNMLNIGQSDTELIDDFGAYHIDTVQEAKFELAFYVIEYANGIEVICNYFTSSFEKSRIEYIMSRFIGLVNKITENPNIPLRLYNTAKKRRKI